MRRGGTVRAGTTCAASTRLLRRLAGNAAQLAALTNASSRQLGSAQARRAGASALRLSDAPLRSLVTRHVNHGLARHIVENDDSEDAGL